MNYHRSHLELVQDCTIPYHEHQLSSDTCRVHAINCMVGRSIVNMSKVYEWAHEWQLTHGIEPDEMNSYFSYDGSSEVSYILEKCLGVPCITFGLGFINELATLCTSDLNDFLWTAGSFCVFTASHIYCLKKTREKNMWWNLDSLKHPSICSFTITNNIGIIVPIYFISNITKKLSIVPSRSKHKHLAENIRKRLIRSTNHIPKARLE